jgi:pimeloyl-ACP methyl ester carboxylesterase
VAWNLANQHPQLLERLLIINSPIPALLARAAAQPAQQAASQYMHFLRRPDAAELLAENARRLWDFFSTRRQPARMADARAAAIPAHWQQSLATACTTTRQPAGAAAGGGPQHPAAPAARQPAEHPVPTQVLWGMDDVALQPELLHGLEHGCRS